MKQKMIIIYILASGCNLLFGQCGLQSGPMPGYSEKLEAMVWAQTKCAQKIQMKYWDISTPDQKFMSEPVSTTAEHGYCAHLLADHVAPGKKYQYTLLIDDAEVKLPYATYFKTQNLWRDNSAPYDFKFTTGSCAFIEDKTYDHPDRPYDPAYEIFSTMGSEQPDLMVWLGDNIYLHSIDWNSKTGIYYRNTYSRSLPELQSFLASTHHYAIWDDHDFGPNDSDGSFWMKDVTLKAFKDFWANPNYGVGGTKGITGTFFWEDCQFFMLDDRWYRGSKPDGDYFGQKQLTWLLQALRYSQATYKFICTGGQVLNDAIVGENFAVYDDERKFLLDSLDKYNIKGVVFLTGDRHFSEVAKVTTADGDEFYDLTISPLTSTTSPHPEETNTNRVPGSIIGKRNYALIEVTGPQNTRECKVTFKTSNGVVINTYTLENSKRY